MTELRRILRAMSLAFGMMVLLCTANGKKHTTQYRYHTVYGNWRGRKGAEKLMCPKS